MPNHGFYADNLCYKNCQDNQDYELSQEHIKVQVSC